MVHQTNSLKNGWKVRVILFLFFIMILVLSLSCSKAIKVYKVGVLSGLNYFYPLFEGFKAKMTEIGYIEGKTIVYDVQKYDVDIDKYRSALNKFVQDKVDLLFSYPTEAAIEAKAITAGTKIPVIFANGVLEGSSFIDSIEAPGSNITGIRFPALEITLRRFDIMMQILPEIKRVWVPYLEGYPSVKPMMDGLKSQSNKVGVKIVEVSATSPNDIQADLDSRSKLNDIGIDAMLLIVEPICITPGVFSMYGKFAAEHKIPVCGVLISDGEYETLFGLIPDDVTTGNQAAILADKVLKGTPAGTIPVGSPEMRLQINYRTAQRLGITIPEALMNQAADIIK